MLNLKFKIQDLGLFRLKKLWIGYTLFLFFFYPLTTQAQRSKKAQPQVSEEYKQAQAEAAFIEGEKYFMLEDYSKALFFFQKTAELIPGNAGVHFKIAETLAKSNTPQDINMAVASAEQSIKFEKKNKYYYQLLAGLYASQQNFLKAAATIETLLNEVSGEEENLFDQAAYLVYANKPDDAVKIYNKAENIFGVNETSSLQKQRIFLEVGKVNEAIKEAEKLIQAFPEEPQYVMAFAEMLNQNGERTRAIQYLENFDKQNPGNGNAKMLLSALYKENGEADRGNALLIDVFDDANVDVTGKLLVIGALSAEIEQARKANTPNTALEDFTVKLFQKLEMNEPTNADVSLLGANLYITIEKNKEAKQYYRKAVKNGASGFEPWQNLLVLESQDNQFDSLIIHSEEGLELFPNQAMLYYFNGFGHLRKKHFSDAAISLEQAKKLSTDNKKFVSEISGMLGDAYNASRQYEKSDLAYEEALAINPDYDYVLNNYSYFLSLRNDKLEKAEAMSAKLTKQFPDNVTYLDTYGWVLYTRTKYKEAKKVFEKITSAGNANATHLEHYGDTLYQLGDLEGAVKQWEKAKSLNANSEALNKKITNRKLN